VLHQTTPSAACHMLLCGWCVWAAPAIPPTQHASAAAAAAMAVQQGRLRVLGGEGRSVR
jgi:hypothetical protein